MKVLIVLQLKLQRRDFRPLMGGMDEPKPKPVP